METFYTFALPLSVTKLHRRNKSLPAGKNCTCGAGCLAVAAADTVNAVGILPDPDIHTAGFLAGTAADAAVLFDTEAVECNRIEAAVHQSERTKVFAERTVKSDRQYSGNKKNGYLKPVAPSDCSTQSAVHKCQRNAAHQRTARTDKFTEPWLADTRRIDQNRRQKQYKNDKHCNTEMP